MVAGFSVARAVFVVCFGGLIGSGSSDDLMRKFCLVLMGGVVDLIVGAGVVLVMVEA